MLLQGRATRSGVGTPVESTGLQKPERVVASEAGASRSYFPKVALAYHTRSANKYPRPFPNRPAPLAAL